MFQWSNQAKGTIITVVGVLAVSPDSLLIREVSNLPNFEVIFYKFLFVGLSLLVALVAYEGPSKSIEIFKELGWIGWTAAGVWTIVNFSINYALQTTSTASSLVILASNPMFSAIFSYFILRETIPLRTILTSLVCFASIVIIFYGQLGGNQGNVIGLIFALISAIAFGLYFVLIRYASVVKGKEPEMTPCVIIMGFLLALGMLPYCGSFVGLTLFELIMLILNGMVVLPIGYTMMTIGPAFISAPEVSLYCLIETIFGPIWVWLGGFEAPPISAAIGGGLLISALGIHSILALFDRPDTEKGNLLSQSDPAEIDEDNDKL